MESAIDLVGRKPWLVFAVLFAAGSLCGILTRFEIFELSRPAVVLFMLSGLLVMWQSTLMAPWGGER
jgi:hypothetical protein